ncbi:isochorismatase family protein [Chloroflexota bacterium]
MGIKTELSINRVGEFSIIGKRIPRPNAVEKLYMGRRQEFGKSPALLVIDVTTEFIGSKPQPVLQSVDEYKTSCGEAGWVILPTIKKLQEACRAKGMPVIFTVADVSARRFTIGAAKVSGPEKVHDPKANEIAEMIKPLPDELVIPKTRASGFFGTPLLSCLRTMNKDTLLIVGGTTSGCLRATVVDAFSYGFRCFIVEEGIFDRFELSHLVNLFDMNAKYADVITLNEALDYINIVIA